MLADCRLRIHLQVKLMAVAYVPVASIHRIHMPVKMHTGLQKRGDFK